MALIGRVKIGLLFLHATFEAVPDIVLQQEEFRIVSGEPRLAVWASGGDFEAFEAALATDSTVADVQHLSDLHEKRLYQIIFPEERAPDQLYPIALEENIIPVRSTITRDGIHLTARFPSREAVATFRDACREREISFTLQQLYREEGAMNDGGLDNPFGVTDPQREALLHALEAGYFAVPRQTKLGTLAEDLGVSSAALSTRLRRGQQNLLQQTLAQDAST
ncbi:helix-turn-helix domain-containing protein [Haloterrigena salinisoli]|uniref:helix-turn-helix domain-containing protein n=1 Tax=Haloterrigena salinisoli TaxID=3132747 RepID=UPI0030D2D687